MKKRVIILLAGLVSLLAFANVAAASGAWGFQPEIPSELRK